MTHKRKIQNCAYQQALQARPVDFYIPMTHSKGSGYVWKFFSAAASRALQYIWPKFRLRSPLCVLNLLKNGAYIGRKATSGTFQGVPEDSFLTSARRFHGIFGRNSDCAACYASLIQPKSPAKRGKYLTENHFRRAPGIFIIKLKVRGLSFMRTMLGASDISAPIFPLDLKPFWIYIMSCIYIFIENSEVYVNGC